MKIPINSKIKEFAKLLDSPLYVVGGFVRNYLINKTISSDVDLAGCIPNDKLLLALKQSNFEVKAVYKHTNTVIFSDGRYDYEYTTFREESYGLGGGHTPQSTSCITDIKTDALRRDFKCNAVYYDIVNEQIVDPLGGLEDIKNRTLDTVDKPKKVFSHDGLRLLRLARFCGELNFTPTEEVLQGARLYADNILDISPERIYTELLKMLESDKKYDFSDKNGHYTSLKILDKTRVLDRIIPELTLGRNMLQRADFHNYDVLEHSLRSVLYSPQKLRLFALLHDVGKPFCMKRDNKYHFHAEEGEKLVEKILQRLKAPKETIRLAKFLTASHMLDMKSDMREGKLRRFMVKYNKDLPLLLALKQADFAACKDNTDTCPTVIKWQNIYSAMLLDGTPFELKDLKITPQDLIEAGYSGSKIGEKLNQLFWLAVDTPMLNDRQKLLQMI